MALTLQQITEGMSGKRVREILNSNMQATAAEAAAVAAAKVAQVKESVDDIAQYIIGTQDKVYSATDATISEHYYYNFYGLSVGSTYNGETFQNTSKTFVGLCLNVKKDDVVEIKTYTTSGTAGYVRPYCLVDSNNIVKQIYAAETTSDVTSGTTISVANDGKLYVDCNGDHSSIFKVTVKGKEATIDARFDALSGEIDAVKSEIMGTADVVYKSDDASLTGHTYYNFNGLSVGSTYNGATMTNGNKNFYCLLVNVSAGDTVKIFTYTTSGTAGYVRPYCLVDSNNIVKQIYAAETTSDVTSGTTISVANDGKLYVDCIEGYEDILKVIIKGDPSFVDPKLDSLKTELETEIQDAIDEASEAKDAVEELNEEIVSMSGINETIALTETNKLLKTYAVGGTADSTPSTFSGYGYATVECREGDEFTITVIGGQNGRAYAFIGDGNVNLMCANAEQVIKNNTFIAPAGTKYAIFNNCFRRGDVEVCINPSVKMVRDAKFLTKDSLGDKVEEVLTKTSFTNVAGFYLPNKKVLLSGASISDHNGYFEYAMKKLGLEGTNLSLQNTNIFYLAYHLYHNGSSTYGSHDLLIISHIHNYNVNCLPTKFDGYTPSDYEGDTDISEYIKSYSHYSGTGSFNHPTYSEEEMYSIGFDYCIKKWADLCYQMKGTSGYDSILGKPCQICLYTYWHDARTTYNNSIRGLAKKWGLVLIKDDENIGFSKDKVHPITKAQCSILHCNGTPWSATTESINGVTYGFHPSGISSADWDTFKAADADTMLSMLPYIQRKRAAILINVLKDAII